MAERTLLLLEKLPDRGPALGQRAQIERDLTEAMGKVSRKLTDRAARFHNTGWVEDPAGASIAITPSGTAVVGKLTMTRPD